MTCRGSALVLVVAAALAGAASLAGCAPSPVRIPPGGQELHVQVEGDTVRLAPATVRAGDVFLVFDSPGADLVMVENKDTENATPGPLSDAQVDRVSHGDTFHTSITSGFPNGEPYGKVSRLVLAPGKYVFLAGDPMSLAGQAGGTIPVTSIAILDVVP